jgi:hypothetical protein
MSLNWLKTTKKRKIITIRELAEHYKLHRNTVTKYARGVNLYDFWECVRLVGLLERRAGGYASTPTNDTGSRGQ